MPAGIIDALCTYVAANYNNGVGVTVWDGEVQRYDPNGQTVSPDSSGGVQDWPVIKFSMGSDFTRNWTFEDPFYDQGEIYCQIFHTTRALAEATMDNVEFLLASLANWTAIGKLIPANPYPTLNPSYLVQLLLKRWKSYQMEGQRTQKSELIYACEMHYDCIVHGAIPTN